MRDVKWSPEGLITQSEEVHATAADMAQAVRQGERVVVRIQESKAQRVLGTERLSEISMKQFRQGCVKSVEMSIEPLPQRGRVLSEIHRRLDCVAQMDDRSASWPSRWVSVFDFAGAWALAARLIREGLSVSVVEMTSHTRQGASDEARADVEIILPIGPVAGCA